MQTERQVAAEQFGLSAGTGCYHQLPRFIMVTYVIRQTIIFSSCFFLISFFFFFFFSSPSLSGRRLDVYHTLAHGVALVRI